MHRDSACAAEEGNARVAERIPALAPSEAACAVEGICVASGKRTTSSDR